MGILGCHSTPTSCGILFHNPDRLIVYYPKLNGLRQLQSMMWFLMPPALMSTPSMVLTESEHISLPYPDGAVGARSVFHRSVLWSALSSTEDHKLYVEQIIKAAKALNLQ